MRFRFMTVWKVALQQQHDDTFAERIKGRILKRFQCFRVHHPVKHLQRRTTLPWWLTGRHGRRRPIVLSCWGTFNFQGSHRTQGRANVHFLVGHEKWRSNRAAEQMGALEAPSSTNGGAAGARERSAPEFGVLLSRLPEHLCSNSTNRILH